VERVDVRVVRLSVLAADRDGRSLTDVRSEDLDVTLDGRELKIAGVHTEVPADGDDLPRVSLRIEIGSDVAERSTTSRRPRYWLLFVDTDNDVPGKLPKVAEAVGGFIEDSVDPSDFVAVVSYNGRLHVEQLFTTDKGDAVSAVEQAYARPRTSGIPTAQRLRSVVNRMDDCRFIPTPGDPTPDPEEGYSLTPDTGALNVPCVAHSAGTYIEEMRFRSDSYYGALERGVRLAAGMPGGPTVLAVSHGVTVNAKKEYMDALRASFGEGQVNAVESALADDESAAEALFRVVELAKQEGVVLYFVDPAKKIGLVRSARQDRIYLSQADPLSTAWASTQNDLRNLAEATGGLFAADSGVVTSLEEFVTREDQRLAVDVYVPEGLDADAIRGIVVRSRDGRIRIAASRIELEPRVPSDLQVVGGAQLGQLMPRKGGLPGGTQIFLLGVRQREMDYAREGNDMVADLSLHVRVETEDGRNLVDSPHVFRHSYPLDKWESVEDGTLAVRGYLEAPPGDYRIVAEFRNARTRRTGRIEQEIHIP
jgi:VWFA-related protein